MKERLKSIEELYICAKCGYCREECPARRFLGFETYCARGKILILRHMIESASFSGGYLVENYYACSLCGYCKQICPTELDLTNLFLNVRGELVENGLVPQQFRDILENIYKHGNAWGLPRARRAEWMKNSAIPLYEPGMEFLYYVGDIGSYVPRAIEAAKALGNILLKCGLRFGVLGIRENCSGSEAFEIGEKGLFELLATSNIQLFKGLNVRKIITLSPHSYHVMKNMYPKFGGDFEVLHYTQLIKKLIEEGKLRLLKGYETKKVITYHDPCFLGRWNKEYSAPREILKAIPNVEFVEMEISRENAFCCGGGGGNCYTGFGGGMFVETEDSPSRIRIREACKSGAEILVVSCPSCLIMFDDALKVEGLEGRMQVKELSEVLWETLYNNQKVLSGDT